MSKTRRAKWQWPLRMWVEMALFHFTMRGSSSLTLMWGFGGDDGHLVLVGLGG